MGSGASKTRQLERLKDRDINNQLQYHNEQTRLTQFHDEEVAKLNSHLSELCHELRNKDRCLMTTTQELEDERRKNMALMYSDLPLHLISNPQATSTSQSFAELSTDYDIVTLAQCDVVGFASLCSILQPHEIVTLVNHIQAIIDEAFKEKEIFIMERSSDGCIAATGLINQPKPDHSKLTTRSQTMTPISQIDSSYGSEVVMDQYSPKHRAKTPSSQISAPSEKGQIMILQSKTSAYFASLLATGALKLMSLSARVKIPQQDQHQLQLRIGLHSGSCSAGVIGLQTLSGALRIPHYKIFGPAVNMTKLLCSTGLALQIRVSKSCWQLLTDIGGYQFERCPDFMTWNGQKPLESYWLVGQEDYEFPLPSLDQAISLSNYDDI